MRYLSCSIDLFSKYDGLFFQKTEMVSLLSMHFKKNFNDSKRKPKKRGLIKAVNFITVLLKNSYWTMT